MYQQTIAPAGPALIDIDPPLHERRLVVKVTDFGATTDAEMCNGQAFRNAIEYCRKQNATHLIVPQGVYYFRSGVHLEFEQLSDFVFDGQGSEFIFATVKPFISIRQCERIVLKHFIVDWDWEQAPLARIGKIVHVEGDYSYFDVLFPEYDKVPEEMEVRGFNPVNPYMLSPGYAGGVEFGAACMKGQRKLNANTMRFFTRDSAEMDFLKEGQCYIVRHYIYDAHGFSMQNNAHLSLEQITVYSCPGHAFLAQGSQHHWQIIDCKIKKRPGTTRCISATADGCHISNSKGFFRMENCDFSYNGDDCLNIHDNSASGLIPISSHTLKVGNVREDRNPFAPGDPLEFRNSDLSPMNLTLEVAEAVWDRDKQECRLTFSEKLPESLPADTILFNRQYDSGNYIVRNNFFHHNRARGILVHASNGLIEDNHFYMNQGSAMRLECGVEQRWAEGFGMDNVIIRNNLIENCDVNHWHMSVIYLGVYLSKGRTNYPVFTNICFEHNTIVDCPQQALYLSSCRHVAVRNNAIVNPNAVAIKTDADRNDGNRVRQRYLYKGTIMASHCDQVYIYNNQRLETVDTSDNGIYIEEGTASNIASWNNKGF